MKKLQPRKLNKTISVIHKAIIVDEPKVDDIKIEEPQIITEKPAPIPEPTPVEITGITINENIVEEQETVTSTPLLKRDKTSKKKNQDNNKEEKTEE